MMVQDGRQIEGAWEQDSNYSIHPNVLTLWNGRSWLWRSTASLPRSLIKATDLFHQTFVSASGQKETSWMMLLTEPHSICSMIWYSCHLRPNFSKGLPCLRRAGSCGIYISWNHSISEILRFFDGKKISCQSQLLTLNHSFGLVMPSQIA